MDNWTWKYQTNSSNKWEHGYEIAVTTQQQSGLPAGHVRIRVIADQLYDVYKSWNKDKRPGQRNIYEKTFFKHLEKIGIFKSTRKHINDIQRTCVDVFHTKVKKLMLEIFPTYQFPQWNTENPEELAKMLWAMSKPKIVDN